MPPKALPPSWTLLSLCFFSPEPGHHTSPLCQGLPVGDSSPALSLSPRLPWYTACECLQDPANLRCPLTSPMKARPRLFLSSCSSLLHLLHLKETHKNFRSPLAPKLSPPLPSQLALPAILSMTLLSHTPSPAS